jgi:hypothetical protein
MTTPTAVIDDFVAMIIEQNMKRGMSPQEQLGARYARDIVNIVASAMHSRNPDEGMALLNAIALALAMYLATSDPANDEKVIAAIGDTIRDKTKLMRPLLGHLILQKILPKGETSESFLHELRAHLARTAPKP